MIIYSPVYIKRYDDGILLSSILHTIGGTISYDDNKTLIISSSSSSTTTTSSTTTSSTTTSSTSTSSSSSPSPISPSSSSSSLCDNNLQVILATSVHKQKRGYYDDYKDFKDAFTPKSIGLQVVKAFVLQSSILSLEYTQHLDQIEAAAAADNEYNHHVFDWNNKINEHVNKFIEFAGRFLITSWLKKTIELYAYYNFDPRTFSRYTKDINKSLLRKIGRYNRFRACLKNSKPYIYCSIIPTSAQFFCDVIFNLYDSIRNKRSYTLKEITIWTVKKSGILIIVAITSAVGHSTGSYIGGVSYGGLIGQLLGEQGGVMLGTALFNQLETLI